MCLAQGPQRSDAGEARTRSPSVSSQALYYWATALPMLVCEIYTINIIAKLDKMAIFVLQENFHTSKSFWKQRPLKLRVPNKKNIFKQVFKSTVSMRRFFWASKTDMLKLTD